MTTRKQRSDSITAQSRAFQSAGDIPVPDGVELETEEEALIWRQFSKVRSMDAWRDFDLVLLSKVVKLEVSIRRHQSTLDKSGPLIKNKRETLVENPLLRVVDTLQRQQMAIIRSMSLNQTDQDPRTLNATGEEAKRTSNLMKLNAFDSLISMPSQKQ
jgi:hypothetical protein